MAKTRKFWLLVDSNFQTIKKPVINAKHNSTLIFGHEKRIAPQPETLRECLRGMEEKRVAVSRDEHSAEDK